MQNLVRSGRSIHPYIGGSVFLVFPWHGYTLWQQNPFGIKPLLGLTASLVLLAMAISGIVLKYQPGWLPLRRLHRAGMALAAFVLLCHILWPL
ncbi:MAG TPA: hypothetical protein VGL27_05975 [Negativicutes bacterium]